MTYLLGWSVIPQILVRRERWPGGCKAKAVPLVHPGQEVQAHQPVIRLEGIEPIETALTAPYLSTLTVKGVPLRADSPQAQAGARERDQCPGKTLSAGLSGRVVAITRRGGVIIESHVAVLQGVIGAGNQVAGKLTMWQPPASGGGEESIPADALLIIPGPLNSTMLRQAAAAGIAGIIASSISSRDLERFLHVDLVKLIDCIDVESAQARLPRLTILLTEGPGTMSMPARTIELLSQYQGSFALLSGATSIRQGIFPELVISLSATQIQQNWRPVRPDTTHSVGVQVRVCSGDHEGAIGIIDYLYAHQQEFASGIFARAARLRLEDGTLLTVPLTLIERIS
ncbi:MAG TPA: hypothetical protein VEL69_04200 [Ktedonobacteraceae bacterium]|nr:hypothetical protein [Ktedonobacteraceae bacterium]